MITFEHSLILKAIKRNADWYPDKIAIISGAKKISYSQLLDFIFYYCAYLKIQCNLKKGDYIVLSATKDLEFVYLYLAAHLLGVINVVVDPTSNDERKSFIIDTIKPKYIFGLRGVENSISYADINVTCVSENMLEEDDSVSENDVADVMFTTGTTGKPKGVQLSHYNLYSSASNINGYIKNTSDDIEVLGLPVCHSFGLGRLRCCLIAGATLILLGSFANLKAFFNALESYNVTGFGMVPAIWNYIKKISGNKISHYADQLRYIEIGSSSMPLDEKKCLLEWLPNTRICMHYGLTEASRSLFMEFHEYSDNLSSIGAPVCHNVNAKIFSEEGVEVSDGEDGEICISGNMVMMGYLNPEDNVNAFWGKYFRTGDWGFRDNTGHFFLKSRHKELINVGGKKVSPIEIEDVIISLGVKDCICVGVKDETGILGEVPKAYILKEGCSLSLNEILEKLSGLLENYKLPRKIEWIDKIPMTSSGKKQRLSLKGN